MTAYSKESTVINCKGLDWTLLLLLLEIMA
jgi:hypothetical protein